MTTIVHNCLQPLSKQLHPCHSIMAHYDSAEKIITLDVHDTRTIPASIVHNQIGKLVSPQCEIALIGPSAVYLVASRFANLYYIVQEGRCSCPRGRVQSCQHVQLISQQQAIPDDDLLAHIEDDLYTVNAIRHGKLVRIREQDLTPAERRAAYHNTFNPCA